jgi:hypothetical protein
MGRQSLPVEDLVLVPVLVLAAVPVLATASHRRRTAPPGWLSFAG